MMLEHCGNFLVATISWPSHARTAGFPNVRAVQMAVGQRGFCPTDLLFNLRSHPPSAEPLG